MDGLKPTDPFIVMKAAVSMVSEMRVTARRVIVVSRETWSAWKGENNEQREF